MKPGSASLNLARAYADMGDVGLSIQHLENHLISDFKTEERKLLLDPHLEKIENSPEWRRLWKTDWFTSLEKGISEIEYQIGRGQVFEARSALKDLSFFYKKSPEINYLSGILSYGEGDYKSAVGFLSDAIAGDYKEYKVWLSYINAQKESAAYLNAVSACNEAMEIYPDRSELYLLRLECNRKAGERQKALNDAKLILQLYPNNEDAIRNAGKLAYENKQYTESLKYLSINIKNQPGNSQYFTDRASVYMATRSWDFAVYDYSMALDLQPMDGEAYYNKAYALLQLGKTEDACHDLKLALKYGNRKASSLINKNCIK
jgi:tetratricopeptide (TPR) repeat protein